MPERVVVQNSSFKEIGKTGSPIYISIGGTSSTSLKPSGNRITLVTGDSKGISTSNPLYIQAV